MAPSSVMLWATLAWFRGEITAFFPPSFWERSKFTNSRREAWTRWGRKTMFDIRSKLFFCVNYNYRIGNVCDKSTYLYYFRQIIKRILAISTVLLGKLLDGSVHLCAAWGAFITAACCTLLTDAHHQQLCVQTLVFLQWGLGVNTRQDFKIFWNILHWNILLWR